MANQELMKVETITLSFGGNVALDHVSFNVKQGEILGLIGPNGAGKTSTLKSITMLYRPQAE
jgi:branched-chain amino acid transport system ATP-binding protein